MSAGWDRARAVADAVLYEGYLLYPYRANSRKNQSRWQFGVLGPQGAADAGIGEDDSLSAQLLVDREIRCFTDNRCPVPAAAAPQHRMRRRGWAFRAGRGVAGRHAVVAQLGRGGGA